jgi:hypothetical protein
MKYSIEIFDTNADLTIVLRNLSLELLQELANKDSVEKIFSEKYYMYGVYDKVDLLGNRFMVLKSSKRNVVLLMI